MIRNYILSITSWTLLVVLLIAIDGPTCVQSDCYAAITEMEDLVKIERRLLNITKDYLKQQRSRLDGLKQFAETVKLAVDLSKDNPLQYLANPVNAYLILKRFASGWKELSSRLTDQDKKIKEVQQILKHNKKRLPTYREDFFGAVLALFRLQDTYNISAVDISEGAIKGVKKSPHRFTAEDCLEIAVVAFRSERFLRMHEWASEAHRVYVNTTLEENRKGNASIVEILEYLAWTEYLRGNVKKALRHSHEILHVDPQHETVTKNIRYFSSYVDLGVPGRIEDLQQWKDQEKNLEKFWFSEYARACRGEIQFRVKNWTSMVCYYKNDNPRLILKPVRTERLYDRPEVLLFHNVLDDREMTKLKELAKPLLKMAKVFHSKTQEIITASYRVSKSAWLDKAYYIEEPVVDRVNQLSEDLTGLSYKTAESLQLNNYGLGGQYEFHKDHGAPGSPLDNHRFGNRIATLLYYLSDVEAGGETVFTKFGLYNIPRRGSALFWHNLFRDGRGDNRTEHASCPVISGSKWVMNKWFHNYGNEFRRPCVLDRST